MARPKSGAWSALFLAVFGVVGGGGFAIYAGASAHPALVVLCAVVATASLLLAALPVFGLGRFTSHGRRDGLWQRLQERRRVRKNGPPELRWVKTDPQPTWDHDGYCTYFIIWHPGIYVGTLRANVEAPSVRRIRFGITSDAGDGPIFVPQKAGYVQGRYLDWEEEGRGTLHMGVICDNEDDLVQADFRTYPTHMPSVDAQADGASSA